MNDKIEIPLRPFQSTEFKSWTDLLLYVDRKRKVSLSLVGSIFRMIDWV